MGDDITGKDFRAAEGVEGWRVTSDGACAFYLVTFSGIGLVSRSELEGRLGPSRRGLDDEFWDTDRSRHT